jgi:hypothetical protein
VQFGYRSPRLGAVRLSGRRKGPTRSATDPECSALNTDHRLLAAGLAVLAALCVAACGPAAAAPAQPVGDGGQRSADLGDIPQPGLATLDLGAAGPGFDGTGDFYSYDSDLSPEATIGAYAGQLLDAGYREASRLGSWRVFVGPVLTVWVRVGVGGPPTSLLVRVQPTTAADADTSDPRPTAAAGDRDPAGDAGGQVGSGGPKATSGPTSQRRPDPPHASTGSTAAGSGSSGSATGGTASGGSSGTGTGTTSGGGTPTASGAPGGSATGTGSGSGSGGTGGNGIIHR